MKTFRTFIAGVSRLVDQNTVPHHITSEIVVVPENAGSHGTYIAFEDLLQLVLEREQIECSESRADLDYQIIVAILSVIPSGTGSEEIHGSHVIFPSHGSDDPGQLPDGILLAERIAEHIDANGTELERCCERRPGIGQTSKYQPLIDVIEGTGTRSHNPLLVQQ